MKVQTLALLFIVCINLCVTMAISLELPATEYMSPLQGGGNSTDYQDQFNSTEVAANWQADRESGLPIVGDIFGGVYFFFNNWEFMVSGLSYVFRWIGDSYLTTATMRTAFDTIANVILAIYAILMAMFLIYLISGREL